MNRDAITGVASNQPSPGKVEKSRDATMAFSSADVDISQIEELLSLAVTERLLRHEQALILVDELRRVGRELYGFDPRAVAEAKQSSG